MAPFKKLLLLFTLSLTFISAVVFPLQSSQRGHYTGDDLSNQSAWTSGLNFHRIGFLELGFVPVEGREIPTDQKITDYSIYGRYTHNPALPHIVQGLLHKIGLKSRLSHQFFSVAVTAAGAVVAWLALALVFETGPALVAWMVLILSPAFVYFADSLYEYPWSFLCRWLLIFRIFYIRREVLNGKPVRLGSWSLEFFILGLFASWLAFDPLPLFLLLGTSILFLKSPKFKTKNAMLLVSMLGLGAVSGFALHFIKNAVALGGIAHAFDDIKSIVAIRLGKAPSAYVGTGYDGLRHLAKYFFGIQWFYTWPLTALAAWGWILGIKKSKSPFYLGFAFCSLFGALFWQFFMKQHSMIHAFTQRHIEVFVVLGCGMFLQSLQPRHFKVAAVATGLLVLTHSLLAVTQAPLTPIKRYAIRHLLPEDELQPWACRQKQRLSTSVDLGSAKELIDETLATVDCSRVSQSKSTVKNLLSEMVLYWR